MSILLGYDDEDQPVRLTDEQLRRHLYLPGLSGTGKSTLMASVLLQTIDSREPKYGAILLDPIGDLVRNVQRRIPAWRHDDVIIVNPLDREYPIALNPFAGNGDDQDADLVLSQLMATYELLFEDKLDPQVEGLLRGVTMTQLAARTDDSSFYPAFDEVPPMLVLETAGDTTKPWFKRNPTTYRAVSSYRYLREAGLTYIWEAYDRLTPNPQARLASSLISRFDRFLGIPIIRNMVCQPGSIDFSQVVDEGKIVLVNLAEQTLGEASNFLAALIMAKVLAAVYRQRDLEVGERPRFAIFADEFYRYATGPFMELFRKGRNFGTSVIVGHTDRGSLWPWQRAALENAQNIVCFNLSAADAHELARTFDATPPPAEPEYQRIYGPYRPSDSDDSWHYLHPDAVEQLEASQRLEEGKQVVACLRRLMSVGFRVCVTNSRDRRHVENLVLHLGLVGDNHSFVGEPDFWSEFMQFADDTPEIVEWATAFCRRYLLGAVPFEVTMAAGTEYNEQHNAITSYWFSHHAFPDSVLNVAEHIVEMDERFLEDAAMFSPKHAWVDKDVRLNMTQPAVPQHDALPVPAKYERIQTRSTGPDIYRKVPGRARPYADVSHEIANELCHQPDYHATCKLAGLTNGARETHIITAPLPLENASWREDEKSFKQQTHDLYCLEAAEVEKLLMEREVARREIIESAERDGLTLSESHKFEQHPDGLSK